MNDFINENEGLDLREYNSTNANLRDVALRKKKSDSPTFLEHQYRKSRYEIYRTLSESVREVGYIADIKALNFVFSLCRQNPYGIRTLTKLKSFLRDTETTETQNYRKQYKKNKTKDSRQH